MISLGLVSSFSFFIERPKLSIQNHSFKLLCVFFFLPSPSFGFLTSNLYCLHFSSHYLPLFSLIYQHFSLSSPVIVFLPNPRAVFSIVHPQYLCDDALKFSLFFTSADMEVSGLSSDFLPVLFVALSKSLLLLGLNFFISKWPWMCQSLIKPLYTQV